jgi:hypothetical protein
MLCAVTCSSLICLFPPPFLPVAPPHLAVPRTMPFRLLQGTPMTRINDVAWHLSPPFILPRPPPMQQQSVPHLPRLLLPALLLRKCTISSRLRLVDRSFFFWKPDVPFHLSGTRGFLAMLISYWPAEHVRPVDWRCKVRSSVLWVPSSIYNVSSAWCG